MSVLTLIRAKEEDSGNYTMRVENGDQSRTVGLILEVKGQRKSGVTPTHFAALVRLHTSRGSLLSCKGMTSKGKISDLIALMLTSLHIGG